MALDEVFEELRASTGCEAASDRLDAQNFNPYSPYMGTSEIG